MISDEELLKAYGSTKHTRSDNDHLTDLRAVRSIVERRFEQHLDDQRKHMALALGLSASSSWEELRTEATRLRKQAATAPFESLVQRIVDERIQTLVAVVKENFPVALTAALDAYEKASKA